ncbi:hypothetical protein [uncultured Methanobrevibacter sp.]|nr:hypothetical protein [uncultured Methanobrevibacter sp.]
MKKDEKSISATVILNKSNSDGFLEYPHDLAKIIDILNENPHD